MLAWKPDFGSRTPTFKAAPWARTIAGAPISAEAAAPAMSWRRLSVVVRVDGIGVLPGNG
jgi:hypothetical protein